METAQLDQILTAEQLEQKEALIKSIESGIFTLSFSAIKEFSKSPASFIAYKLGDKEQTDAMKMGSALHCAILEPEDFEKRYLVFRKEDLPFPESTMNKTENKEFKQKLMMKAELEGKDILDPSEWDECLRCQKIVWSNQIAARYIKNFIHKEQAAEWVYQGLRWRGFLDGVGQGYLGDLKKVMDANPERIKRSAIYDRWHWQGALYKQSDFADEFTGFYNIAVDKNSVGVYSLGEYSDRIAHAELNKVIDAFKRCTDLHQWDEGYEFWSEHSSGTFQF